jgi:hypothetical protein
VLACGKDCSEATNATITVTTMFGTVAGSAPTTRRTTISRTMARRKREADRAIINSSSVRMTRTVVALASVDACFRALACGIVRSLNRT